MVHFLNVGMIQLELKIGSYPKSESNLVEFRLPTFYPYLNSWRLGVEVLGHCREVPRLTFVDENLFFSRLMWLKSIRSNSSLKDFKINEAYVHDTWNDWCILHAIVLPRFIYESYLKLGLWDEPEEIGRSRIVTAPPSSPLLGKRWVSSSHSFNLQTFSSVNIWTPSCFCFLPQCDYLWQILVYQLSQNMIGLLSTISGRYFPGFHAQEACHRRQEESLEEEEKVISPFRSLFLLPLDN